MTYAWFDAGDGRKVYRRVSEPKGQRSTLPCPRLVRDFAEPVQSMADGKWYTSKAALAASYKAENNPQGINYVEVGNEDTTKFTRPKRDRKADRDAIERAISAVESGNAPPLLTETPV